MTETDTKSHIAHLRTADTSVIVAADGGAVPQILYWGSDLGDLTDDDLHALLRAGQPRTEDSVVNTVSPAAVVPQLADGWLGAPGLECHRGSRAWAPRFVTTGWHAADQRLQVLLLDRWDSSARSLEAISGGLRATLERMRANVNAHRGLPSGGADTVMSQPVRMRITLEGPVQDESLGFPLVSGTLQIVLKSVYYQIGG